MAYKKRVSAALTATTPVTLPVLGLGATYARVYGFQCRNWSSSAKTAGGTDAAGQLKFTDADGVIFFLDAVDRDYKTTLGNYWIVIDDTLTGLTSTVGVDGTGAVRAAGEASFGVIAKSPVTIVATNFATTTDYLEVGLFVEV